MNKLTKFSISLLAACLLLSGPSLALVQAMPTPSLINSGEQTDNANNGDAAVSPTAGETENGQNDQGENNQGELEEVITDETVSAEELGIGEPRLLPDSRFYFLKNWRRGIRSFFTFSKVKKAELKARYAAEKLLEARKLAEKKKKAEDIKEAAENYQEELDRLKKAVDKIKDTASTSEKVGKFLDKFTHQQILHQKILDKLEIQVPTSTMETIRQARERHLVRFGEVMQKLEDKTQLKARLENTFREIQGSELKDIKHIEILKRFEEKATEEVKEKLKEAREEMVQRFQEKWQDISEETKQKLDQYVEEIKGLEQRKREVLEDIKSRIRGAGR